MSSLTNELSYLPALESELPSGPWLVLAPHPDDETFGMGGVLLLAKKSKIDVDVIFVTDGHAADLSDSKLAKKREQEAKLAGKHLGFRKVLFWREIDRKLNVSLHLIKKLSKVIETKHYATVFFPSPQEPHPDHRATAVLAWEALRKIAFKATPVSYDISVQGYTNSLIDITNVVAEKEKIMACYSSQMANNHYIERILGLNQSRAWSLPLSVSHAESFYFWPKEDRPLNALFLSIANKQATAYALPDSLPLVSVITRTQNRADFLRKAIRSVAGQTYPNIELIVVNDGGEEFSKLVQEEALGSIRTFTYQHIEQQTGRSHAANIGLNHCTGDNIIFLDDDDWFLPEHIESLVHCLQDNTDFIAAYNNVACVHFENNQWNTINEYKDDFDANRLAYENYIPIHSILFRKKVIEAGCVFAEEMNTYEDWAFWMKVSQIGSFFHNPILGAMYRVSISSGSGLPGTNRDFSIDYKRFINWVKLEWSYDQAHTLVRNSVNLKEIKRQLTQVRVQVAEYSELNNALKTEKNRVYEENLKLTEEKNRVYEENLRLTEEKNRVYEENLKLTEEKNRVYEENLKLTEEKNKAVKDSREFAAEHTRLNNEIDFFLTSKSWTMTKPLRDSRRRTERLFRQVKLASQLIYEGRFGEVIEILKQKVKGKPPTANIENNAKIITILTTPHTLFVAHLIDNELRDSGFHTEIITNLSISSFTDNVYIVICPQMFTALPANYFAFQMEQSIHSRWFTDEYFTILKNSIATLDYSLDNINFLQKNEIEYRQTFYLPISYFQNYKKYLVSKGVKFPKKQQEKYDVLFYGDEHCERRKLFLDALKTRFKVKIISNLFSEQLYPYLLSAKVVVNIHYYEDALLETTRIYECLSLGIPVISEMSSNTNEYQGVEKQVIFTPINNIEAMIDSVDKLINTKGAIAKHTKNIKKEVKEKPDFSYFFNRLLLAYDLINYTEFYRKVENYPTSITESNVGNCLTLPETRERQVNFIKQKNSSDFSFYNGLRHQLGWIGCGLSYKDMINRAKDANLEYVIICEDDVEFYEDLEEQLALVLDYLKTTKKEWHIFSGFIAIVHNETQINHIEIYQEQEFIHIDKMISAVFNIYHKSVFDRILTWDETDHNDQTNTIDKFIESSGDLKVITTLPFLVGHHEEMKSTLWGFTNSAYNPFIKESSILLRKKVDKFKNEYARKILE
jgi:LmbE family N-acetylglucosaminyl deacetylase/glycosyltransferase involved in cell wall biosynthesis